MKRKRSIDVEHRNRSEQPEGYPAASAWKGREELARFDPVVMAESRTIELIKKREKILARCKECGPRDEVRFKYAMALRKASEDVFAAIKLWQQVRFAGGDLDFAWNGFSSYGAKIYDDAQQLSKNWSVSESNFISREQRMRFMAKIATSSLVAEQTSSLPGSRYIYAMKRSRSLPSLPGASTQGKNQAQNAPGASYANFILAVGRIELDPPSPSEHFQASWADDKRQDQKKLLTSSSLFKKVPLEELVSARSMSLYSLNHA